MTKKKKKMPVPRGVWKINPKTRVKPTEKAYHRPKSKQEIKKELEESSEF